MTLRVNGRRSTVEDYVALLSEPLESVRRRLNIADPAAYRIAQARLREQGIQGI